MHQAMQKSFRASSWGRRGGPDGHWAVGLDLHETAWPLSASTMVQDSTNQIQLCQMIKVFPYKNSGISEIQVLLREAMPQACPEYWGPTFCFSAPKGWSKAQ